MGQIQIFGNVAIPCVKCPCCNETVFVVKGRTACCDRSDWDVPDTFKRISQPEYRRRQLTAQEKRDQLINQNFQCIYCERRFGESVQIGTKFRKITVNWDHFIPFSFLQDNSKKNYVAACCFCNRWKHSKCFQTLDDARIYLATKWQEAFKSNG